MLLWVAASATPSNDCVPVVYDKVLIYRNHAVAFASATFPVAGGQHSQLLCNLTVNHGRVDATVSSSSGSPSEFVSLAWVLPPSSSPSNEANIAAARRRLAELEDAHDAARVAKQSADDEQAIYARAATAMTHPSDSIYQKLSGGGYLETLREVAAMRAAAAERAMKAATAFRAALAARDAAVKELDELTRPPGGSVLHQKIPLLTLGSTGPAEVRVVLRHVVSMGWTPQYEVSVDTVTRTAKVQYMALVTNNHAPLNCSIELSTADTMESSPPPLAPVHLRPSRMRPPEPAPSSRAQHKRVSLDALENRNIRMFTAGARAGGPKEDNEQESDDGDDGATPPTTREAVAEEPPPRAAVTLTATADLFSLPGVHLLGVGGGVFRVAALLLDARVDRFVVPKLNPNVHLEAVVINSSPYTLRRGPVRLVVDDSAESRSDEMPTTAPFSGEARFSAGVDAAVRVTRRVTRVETQVGGLLSKSERRRDVNCTITLRSTRPGTTPLRVRDVVPLSASADVRVALHTPRFERPPTLTVDGVSPDATNIAGGKALILSGGLVEWETAVAETPQVLTLHYTVSTDGPADIEWAL